MRLFKKLATAIFFSLGVSSAIAQSDGLNAVDGEALKQAEQYLKEQTQVSKEVWRAVKKQRDESRPAFDFTKLPKPPVAQQPIPGLENLFKQKIDEIQGDPLNLYKIAVFISFNMPEESLKRLFAEANPLRGRIAFILRGYDESKDMLQTTRRVDRLLGKSRVDVNIDPELFERFGIHSAPAIVVYRDDPAFEQACILAGKDPSKEVDEYIGAYGDVSLLFALEHLNKSPLLSSDMKHFVDYSVDKLSPKLSVRHGH